MKTLKLEAVPVHFECACGWKGLSKEEWHDHRVEGILKAIMSVRDPSERLYRKAIRHADETHGAFAMRTG
jgi:hypothetical protein